METITCMDAMKDCIRPILERPLIHPWTLQGFGMLRLYMKEDKSIRLHIWDPRYRNEDVSEMHTHPWDFTSYVIAGSITDHKFSRATDSDIEIGRYDEFNEQSILCGVGGGLKGDPMVAKLNKLPATAYRAGTSYQNYADEIHVSAPEPGSVTLVYRYFREDTEHASVFWDIDKEWVTAEPRRAVDNEVNEICSFALEAWF